MPEIRINLNQRVYADLFFLDQNAQSDRCIALLHGLGGNSDSWGYQLPALGRAGMRCIVPDIPGFGKSRFVGRKWNIALVAQMVAGLLQQLSAGAADVVGISMGGAIALQLALDYPEQVKRLVCVNTFANLRPQRLDQVVYLLMRYIIVNWKGAEAQAEMVARRIFPENGQEPLRQALIEQILQADGRVYRAAMRSLALFNVRRRLVEIRAPTLVITGGRDTTVPAAAQAELVRSIPGACQMIIPDGGHGVIADQPEAFNQVLEEFLSGRLGAKCDRNTLAKVSFFWQRDS